jgi:hypothetical protein
MATEQLPLDPPEIEQETTLREDIDAAFTEHATDEVDQPATGDRARDAAGRFARQDADDEKPPVQAPARPQAGSTAPAGTQPPIPPAPAPNGELKAPASWTPAAREKWTSVDPDVRAEIHRRESEGQRLLQDTAGLRQFAQQFDNVVRPYEMFIRSEGSDPLSAVQGLMNTAAELRVGTPQQKAHIVANIVRQHGIDLELLDHTLAQVLGVTQPGQQAPQQLRDPRVDQLLAQQQRQQWEQQQYLQQQDALETQTIQQGLAHFASTHEFYTDVASTMADLVDVATRQGQPINLERIYARACQLDEQVSTIISQRGGAQPGRPGVPQTSQAVLRAKRAAASVKGDPNPAGSTVPKDDSIRASIEAAYDAHS